MNSSSRAAGAAREAGEALTRADGCRRHWPSTADPDQSDPGSVIGEADYTRRCGQGPSDLDRDLAHVRLALEIAQRIT